MKAKCLEFVWLTNWTETGGSFERSYQSILNRLTKNAIRMQIPIGEEEKFEAVIDLLRMKAYYFEGEMGRKSLKKKSQRNIWKKAKKYRAETVEKIVEQDEKSHERLFGRQGYSFGDFWKTILRKATIDNTLVPVMTGSALKNKGIQLTLDAVIDYLPSPLDIPPVKGNQP